MRALLGSVAVALLLAACGGDKPPMVPDPDTSSSSAPAPSAAPSGAPSAAPAGGGAQP